MKKYLYLLAGLAAGFVLVFMGTAICQYLHLTQSGYVRYDDLSLIHISEPTRP